MNYQKHYNNLIEKAKNSCHKEYTEKHHILPRCLGGKDNKENIVRLTPEEHYVAHQLLFKMYPEEWRLVYALSKMTRGRPSNKRYGWVKRRWQEVCKKRTGNKNGSYGKSWYYNPETLENIKCFPEKVPDGYIKGRYIHQENKRNKKFTNCVVCNNGTNSIKAKFCETCRHKEIAKNQSQYDELIYYKNEFIEEYRKTKSMNRALKNLGYPGAKGNWYKQAKEILEII